MKTYDYLLDVIARRGAGFITLLDPDRQAPECTVECAVQCAAAGADAIFCGGSLLMNNAFDTTIREIKKKITIPVIIFPGDATQVSPAADAVLFLSLLSGRNPDYLVGNQVKAAPRIKEFGLEPIPTAYLLIESGRTTSVQFMSSTQPIPRDKVDIIKAHALCAEYLGMKLVFLEAGSGAEHSVSDETVAAVHAYCNLPLIVGGGIRKPEDARSKVEHGAGFVVIGTAFEHNSDPAFLRDFAQAVHSK
jgi:putative glycerol-1-phosphate prenyltransferase